MPRQYSRNRRVGDLVQRELANMIQKELGDAQLGLITVSNADVSPDLKYAKIYVTSLGNDIEAEVVIKALNDLAGHFRHELAKVLRLRVVPKLAFQYDSSIERARHLTTLIDSLHKDDNNPSESGEPDGQVNHGEHGGNGED
jgi:ribosome-binding factor A